MLSAARYRFRQFWSEIRAGTLASQDIEFIATMLTPAQQELFNRLQPGEQTHALQVLKTLQKQGQTQPDLQVAALLHDIGKVRVPITVWERILIVLSRAFFPKKVEGWGNGLPVGWRRAFVVAQQHPAWGAEMAAQAGASALTVSLIERHQTVPESSAESSLEDHLLVVLQAADNQN